MQTILIDQLVTVSGGQTPRPAIAPLPSPGTPSPAMTRPPNMGFDAVRQYGGVRPANDGDGSSGGGGHSRQIVKRHMLM